MKVAMFKPRRQVDSDRYGLAVCIGVRNVMVVETFPNIEQLEAGYNDFHKMAKIRRLHLPVPIEYIGEANERGTRPCKIVDSMLKK